VPIPQPGQLGVEFGEAGALDGKIAIHRCPIPSRREAPISSR
jgi:hypothetical protein